MHGLDLTGSGGVRVYLHGQGHDPGERATDSSPVDLGEGVFLSMSEATSRTGRIPCDALVAIELV